MKTIHHVFYRPANAGLFAKLLSKAGIALLFPLLAASPAALGNDNFAQAEQTNTIEGYRSYQQSCISCTEYEQAVAAIRDMRGVDGALAISGGGSGADEGFAAASAAGTEQALNNYQQNCVTCSQYTDTVSQIRRLNGLESEPTGAFLAAVLFSLPEGGMNNDSTKMAASVADEGYAAASGRFDALRAYQQSCTDCAFYAEAIEQIRSLDSNGSSTTTTTIAAASGDEQGLYAQASTTNDVSTWQAYQRQCVACEHYSEAIQALRTAGVSIAAVAASGPSAASGNTASFSSNLPEGQLFTQAQDSGNAMDWRRYQASCVSCDQYASSVAALRAMGGSGGSSASTSSASGAETAQIEQAIAAGNEQAFIDYQNSCISCDFYPYSVAALRALGNGNALPASPIKPAVYLAALEFTNNSATTVAGNDLADDGTDDGADDTTEDMADNDASDAESSAEDVVMDDTEDDDTAEDAANEDTAETEMADAATDETPTEPEQAADMASETEVAATDPDDAEQDNEVAVTLAQPAESAEPEMADDTTTTENDVNASGDEEMSVESGDNDVAMSDDGSMGGGVENENSSDDLSDTNTESNNDTAANDNNDEMAAETADVANGDNAASNSDTEQSDDADTASATPEAAEPEATESEAPETETQEPAAPIRVATAKPAQPPVTSSKPAPQPVRNSTPRATISPPPPPPPTRERSQVRSVYDPNASTRSTAKPRTTYNPNQEPDAPSAAAAVNDATDETADDVADTAEALENNTADGAEDKMGTAAAQVNSRITEDEDNDELNDELERNAAPSTETANRIDGLFQPADSFENDLEDSGTTVISTPRDYIKPSTRDLKTNLRGHSQRVWIVDFADNGTLASGSDDSTAKLWQTDQRTATRTLRGHRGLVAALDFADDGSRLATGAADGRVIIWDAFTGQKISTISGFTDDVAALAFAPNGEALVIADANEVSLYDAESGNRTREILDAPEGVLSVDYAANGQLIAITTTQQVVVVDQRGDTQYNLNNRSQTYAARFSANSELLAIAGADGNVALYNARDGELSQQLPDADASLLSLALSSDGQWLAAGGTDSVVYLYDLGSNNIAARLNQRSQGIYSLAFSPDGQVVAVTTGNNNIKLLDLSDY